jgi:hypothetical protein
LIWTCWGGDPEYYQKATLDNFIEIDDKSYRDSINRLTSNEMKMSNLRRKRDGHSGFITHKVWSLKFLEEIKSRKYEDLSVY